MLTSQKHTITCTCILPQHKDLPDPQNYSFIVFSILEDGIIKEKYVECENCKNVHRVYELCKSNIITTDTKIAVSLDDIKLVLPDKLVRILEDYSAPLWLYEEAKFILNTSQWGRYILLTKEPLKIKNELFFEGKKLIINGYNSFSIDYWKAQY
jgi:hypothetical protein